MLRYGGGGRRMRWLRCALGRFRNGCNEDCRCVEVYDSHTDGWGMIKRVVLVVEVLIAYR